MVFFCYGVFIVIEFTAPYRKDTKTRLSRERILDEKLKRSVQNHIIISIWYFHIYFGTGINSLYPFNIHTPKIYILKFEAERKIYILKFS